MEVFGSVFGLVGEFEDGYGSLGDGPDKARRKGEVLPRTVSCVI